jgi:hypothetical protein
MEGGPEQPEGSEETPTGNLAEEISQIAKRCAARPVLDARTPRQYFGV